MRITRPVITLILLSVAVTIGARRTKQAAETAETAETTDVTEKTVVEQQEVAGADPFQILVDYIDENPTCRSEEVLYEGCTLMMNSDGEYLFGQLNILHPELQMRILMQGITFYIDPTGKNKEKFSLVFPAASAVESIMSDMAPPQPDEDTDQEVLPDITPLVAALSALGAQYDINGRAQDYAAGNAAISVDTVNNCLSYTFLVPIEDMLAEKKLDDTWSIGLYSEGNSRGGMGSSGMGGGMGSGMGMGGPGMGGPGMGGPGMGMGGPGMGMGARSGGLGATRKERSAGSGSSSQVDLRKIMMGDLESWITVSFSDLCSVSEQ